MENIKKVVADEALAQKLINENCEANREISICNDKIFELQQKIKKNNTIIFINCKHDWKYDEASYLDRTRYNCNKCGLWRNHCWYS